MIITYMMIGTVGVFLGFMISKIPIKKKPVPTVYIRRGIYDRKLKITTHGKSEDIEVQYEVGEVESTSKRSKVEVLSFTVNSSTFSTEEWDRKIRILVDGTWIDSTLVEWIDNTSESRNRKIEEILK